MKPRNEKSKTNPNPKGKSKTLWGRGKKERVWAARWTAFPVLCIRPLRVALDISVVVIDELSCGLKTTLPD